MVVGASGHGLARRLLVGSVAERTAETSPIPTLVVRPGSRLGSWVSGEHPLKILVGYDFSPASDAALRWVNEMQQIGPCETSVLHIDWPPEEAERLGYHGPLPLTMNPMEIQSFLERDLAEHVALRLPPEGVTVTVEPSWGHPAAHLFEKVKREQIDLVVIGTHHRHGWSRLRFGSVSRSVFITRRSAWRWFRRLKTTGAGRCRNSNACLSRRTFPLGNSAVPYGCAILHRGGTLKILHVMEEVAAKSKPRPDKDNPKLRSELRSLVPSDARNRFRIEPEIVENADAAEAIRQSAERFNADVICLGSHGRSGLARTLLGSVTQAVMATSRRPVLIVREETL